MDVSVLQVSCSGHSTTTNAAHTLSEALHTVDSRKEKPDERRREYLDAERLVRYSEHDEPVCSGIWRAPLQAPWTGRFRSFAATVVARTRQGQTITNPATPLITLCIATLRRGGAKANPVSGRARWGGRSQQFRGLAQQAVKCAENSSVSDLIDGSHRLSTVVRQSCPRQWTV